jgi:hypothetical protein
VIAIVVIEAQDPVRRVRRLTLAEARAVVRWSRASCGGCDESGDSKQVVGGSHQIGMQLGAVEAAITSTPQAAHVFIQPKISSTRLAYPLTHRVAYMPRCRC